MQRRAMTAGFVYFAVVFCLGFVLGTLRVVFIAPALGSETCAVLLELPLMLLASWVSAGRLVGKFRLSSGAARAVMGSSAFALLMLAEAILAPVLSQQPIESWFRSLVVLPGVIGFAGQIAFAVMPLLGGRG